MVRFVALLLAVACVGATAGHAETAAPNPPIADLPKRKPGLWRISTISPEIGMLTHEVCIEKSDGIVGAPDENCAKPLVERASDQTIVTIACDRKDGREVTSILFTGDFQDWYRAQSKASSTDAVHGTIWRSGFTIEARHLRDECSCSLRRVSVRPATLTLNIEQFIISSDCAMIGPSSAFTLDDYVASGVIAKEHFAGLPLAYRGA